MAYIDGFVLAVPNANKDAYQKMASDAAAVFRRLGAIGFVENWGLEVPQGKVTCFNSAVMRKPDETVMFSWIVWPDRAARDAGNKAMMDDPAFEGMSPETMPFDGQRMICGGFEPLFGDALAAPGIVDGTLMPVPAGSRAAYTAAAEKLAAMFVEHGATTVVDAWGEDLPEGKVNSFHTAVLKKPDENVIFSWINWKDAATRQAGWDKAMADPRMAEFSPVTTGADLGRMIYGTFEPLVVG
jgi:uncharacterized protein YbaA (DUF1428 family)